MSTLSIPSAAAPTRRFPAWLPLIVLPTAAVICGWHWPGWVLMWALAYAIFAGLKWLSLADWQSQVATRPNSQFDIRNSRIDALPSPGPTLTGRGVPLASLGRTLGYLFLWPGMDARAFFDTDAVPSKPTLSEASWAAGRIAFGVALIYIAAPFALANQFPLVAGWLGMTGILLVLHFGLFQLLSIAWRNAGVAALPLMNNPLRSQSLGDFWGRRWNAAVRDLAHRHLFLPLVGRCGVAGATLVVFFISGVVHDLVISLPARGGWGWPTLYFLLQGCGLLVERSRWTARWGLRRGLKGRLFCAAVTIGPLAWLFHSPFVREVVLPMLHALGATMR